MPSMGENVALALIVAASTVGSPLLMAWLQGRNLRKVKEQDYARQDVVAERLFEQQEKVSARLLVNNTLVAVTSSETLGQLKVIHGLVNSQMTAALQSELDTRRHAQVLMMEVVDLKRASGHEPAEATLQESVVNGAKIAELERTIAERARQQAEAAAKPAA